MFEQIIQLIGLTIDHPTMQEFLLSHGFKLPKKTEISGRASDRSFWIEHKKLGVNLLFSIDIKNPQFPPIAADKKGLWKPVLSHITFTNSKLDYPLNLQFGLSIAETKTYLGEPHYKSSDIHKIWLNEDGCESFYGWVQPLDENKQIQLSVRIKTEDALDEIDVSIKYLTPVLTLFDALNNQTIDTLVADNHHFNEATMLLAWCIQHEFYRGEPKDNAMISQVKAGKASIIDYLRQHHQMHIYKEQFASQFQTFIHQYCNNMSGFDILYARDFAYCFLDEPKLRQNYMGEAAINQLKSIQYTDEHQQLIFKMLDQRFAEFIQHGFAKSSPNFR
ncbi:MAG: hypothetical protein WBP13_06420 [Methylophilaceae bacterium]